MTKLFALVIAAGGSPDFDNDDLHRNKDGSFIWYCPLLKGTHRTINVTDVRREAKKYLGTMFKDAEITENGDVEIHLTADYDIDNEAQVPDPTPCAFCGRLEEGHGTRTRNGAPWEGKSNPSAAREHGLHEFISQRNLPPEQRRAH